ncbi:MAG: hypothetical protein LBQ26_01550, partial [Holosporales bacterium]|nr:hypothetical protein [Holosporales bacterium]
MPKKTGISSRLSAFFSGSKKREAGAKKENREQINNPSRHLALSLKGVFDKFLRKTTVSLRTLAKCGIDAKEERIYVVPFGKYIEELPSPSFIAIFYITEWSSFVILRIEEGLLDPLIEALLGGGTYEQQGKKTDIATQIERTLLE